MMTLLAKIRRRSTGDLGLAAEAFVRLLEARACLLIRPFRRIAPRLGRLGYESADAPLRERDLVRRVGWAVTAVARHVPLGFVCLPQAMAAQRMLRRRGIATTLYLGVRPEENSGLSAHAWIRAGDFVLTGRRESRQHKALAAFGDGFQPETEMLLALLRAALGREERRSFPVGNPKALVRRIARHRVGAFLHHRLPDAARRALPDEVRGELARLARANALRALAQGAELARLAGIFQAAGLPFVNVKGLLLSCDLYGDAVTRHAGDIDLLIDIADLPRAEGLLGSAGYRRARPAFEMTPRQMRHYGEKEFEYRGGSHEMRVELTWRLDGVGTLRELTAIDHASLQDLRIPVPSQAENSLYLFQHGAKHGWRRLFWLLDVATLLERDETDWESLLRQAKSHGIERAVLEGAALAEGLLGAPLPALLRTPADDRGIPARLLRNAKEQIAMTNADATGIRNFLRDVSHRLLLQRHLSGKWREIAPHVHSARNWEELRLPDPLFWLYVPLAPLLWLRRRLFVRR